MIPPKGILFQDNGTAYKIRDRISINKTVQSLLEDEQKSIAHIGLILCTDDFLLEMNQRFLEHDYYTDVITFDYSSEEEKKNGRINGEIYISIDRIRENAESFQQAVENELARVIFHGVLHLCGYVDESDEDREEMRKLENKYLKIWECST